jgi:hypothetical protein
MSDVTDPKFDFIEVITNDGVMIEVRERASGKLDSRIEPDLFEYMLKRAWDEVNSRDEKRGRHE